MILNDFLEFETSLHLFDKIICNIKFWHIIRKHVYDNIVSQIENINEAHEIGRSNNILLRILVRLIHIPSWIVKSPLNLKEKDFLVICHHRRVKDKKFYRCIYTDDLLSELNDSSYYVFEDPMLDFHYRKVQTKNLKYLDYIYNEYAFIRVKNRLMKKSILSDDEKREIEKLIKLINLSFGVNLNERKFINDVQNHILKYNVFYKHFNKIINKINPKVIIEVVSYDFSRMVLNEVAHNSNIPVIELQHGTMGKYHEAYNFSRKSEISTFPDYIFTFGQFWNDDTRLPINDNMVRVVGWPFFERKVKEKNINTSIEDKKTILFVSQGTIGIELSKIANSLFSLIDKNKYNIIYKLHPGEYSRWREKYPWLVLNDIEVIDKNDHDLHYYFAKSDYLIGVNSTALFEGLGYNLRPIIVSLFGYETMNVLIEKGVAVLVKSPEDILEICENKQSNKCKLDISYFWTQNSLDNMIKEIFNVIKEWKTL